MSYGSHCRTAPSSDAENTRGSTSPSTPTSPTHSDTTAPAWHPRPSSTSTSENALWRVTLSPRTTPVGVTTATLDASGTRASADAGTRSPARRCSNSASDRAEPVTCARYRARRSRRSYTQRNPSASVSASSEKGDSEEDPEDAAARVEEEPRSVTFGEDISEEDPAFLRSAAATPRSGGISATVVNAAPRGFSSLAETAPVRASRIVIAASYARTHTHRSSGTYSTPVTPRPSSGRAKTH